MPDIAIAAKPYLKRDFAYTLASGSPDVTVVCFDSEGPVNVRSNDPGLTQIQRGDKVTFTDRRQHTDFWPRTYTVFTITKIERYTPAWEA